VTSPQACDGLSRRKRFAIRLRALPLGWRERGVRCRQIRRDLRLYTAMVLSAQPAGGLIADAFSASGGAVFLWRHHHRARAFQHGGPGPRDVLSRLGLIAIGTGLLKPISAHGGPTLRPKRHPAGRGLFIFYMGSTLERSCRRVAAVMSARPSTGIGGSGFGASDDARIDPIQIGRKVFG